MSGARRRSPSTARISDCAARPIQLKLECLQHTGTFKARGAFTNLMTRAVPDAGVVAASGGNHGVAVAYAAMKRGVRATIFVPKVSSPAKIELIRHYGADLVVTGERYADALAASEVFVRDKGALPIHAYDQPETLLGQGTVGLEIEADTPEVDTLLVAVGGGGLIGGIAAWFASRIRVIAVEPEGSPTLYRALAAGEPVDAPAEGIAADSLAPKQVGRDHVPDRAAPCAPRGSRLRRRHPRRAKGAVGPRPRRHGAGWGRSLCRAAVRRLCSGAGGTAGGTGLRRQHDGGEVRLR